MAKCKFKDTLIQYNMYNVLNFLTVIFIRGRTSTEVNKGTLLSEVRVATVRKCKPNVKRVWVEVEVYVNGVRKSKFWLMPCVSVLTLRMRVCSSINLSVLLEKSTFNITHSRSQI